MNVNASVREQKPNFDSARANPHRRWEPSLSLETGGKLKMHLESDDLGESTHQSPVGWSMNTQGTRKRRDRCSARARTPNVSVA